MLKVYPRAMTYQMRFRREKAQRTVWSIGTESIEVYQTRNPELLRLGSNRTVRHFTVETRFPEIDPKALDAIREFHLEVGHVIGIIQIAPTRPSLDETPHFPTLSIFFCASAIVA
jgi:hypothetical protein